MKVDFDAYFQKYKLKVLAGRIEGAEYRKELHLDKIDKEIESTEVKIEINIPQYFLSITSSFFLGCFGKSIRNLGESKFRERYIFTCDDALRTGIEDGISRALNDSKIE